MGAPGAARPLERISDAPRHGSRRDHVGPSERGEQVVESFYVPETVLQPDRNNLSVRLPENGGTYKDLIEEYERRLVRTALRRTGGVQKRASELLKMKPTTLREIIKRLEIQES